MASEYASVRLERGALAGERRPAQRRRCRRGRCAATAGASASGAQLVDLAVDPGAALLGGRLGLAAPGGHVGGDLVALVGQRLGEGEGVLGLLGEGHQVLGVLQLPGGGEDARARRLRRWRRPPRPPRRSAGCVRGWGWPLAATGALAPPRRRLPCPEAVCLPVRRGRVFCTGARIPDSCTQGPGDAPSSAPLRSLDCVQPVSHGSRPSQCRWAVVRASPAPPPEGVNIGGELAGKFLWRVRRPCAAGRLDVGGGLWQYSPPRLPGVRPFHSQNQAADLRCVPGSASDASLLRTL